MTAHPSHGVQRGEVWTADLDPVVGHEQGGRRPCLVVSTDLLHAIPSRHVIVVPISSRDRRVRSHVSIGPPEGGLNQQSFAMTEQLRTVSVQRLGRRLGHVESVTMDSVMTRLRWFLDL